MHMLIKFSGSSGWFHLESRTFEPKARVGSEDKIHKKSIRRTCAE